MSVASLDHTSAPSSRDVLDIRHLFLRHGAADFALRVMHFGELLDEANPAARETVHAQLIALFAQHRTSVGITMEAKAFLVSARTT